MDKARRLPLSPAAVLVTLVAIHAVVNVTPNTLMPRVSLRLGVAIGALEHREVVGVRVTRRTDAVGITVIHREPRVVELAVRPLHGVVAHLAGRRKAGRGVLWIDGVLIVGLVAAVTGSGQVRVIVVDVAVGAESRRHGVGTGERESGLAVVEVGVGPGDGVVTELACLRKTGSHVVRIVCAVKVIQVASHARRVIEFVIVINVAIGALARRHGMFAGQRPARLSVIELAVGPGGGIVTGIARGREVCTDVIDRRLGVVVVGLMARDTGGSRDVVIAIDVAVGALTRWHRVLARQYPTGLRVIEFAIGPLNGIVAVLAARWEFGGYVVDRNLGVVVVGLVARNAGRVGNVVIVIDVAVGALAGRYGVLAGEWEAGFRVIKIRRLPG